jgi:hypothetical protein
MLNIVLSAEHRIARSRMQVQPPVDPGADPRPSREEARRLARTTAVARRRRIRSIRRSALGLTLSLFIAAWVTIFVQLASGHDPALAAAARGVTKQPATASSGSSARATGSAASGQDTAAGQLPGAAAATDTSAPPSTASRSSSAGQSASSAQLAAPSPAPVTTSQS